MRWSSQWRSLHADVCTHDWAAQELPTSLARTVYAELEGMNRASHDMLSDSPPRPVVPLSTERTQIIRVDGLRLLCRHWGDASAPAVVLLHGLRGFSGTWRALAASLAIDYHLIALDQRGRGESDWDPHHNYYTDAYLADLEGVVDQLALARFALLGHSMGGTTSYVYASRHRERLASLIIEDIAPGSSVRRRGAERIVAEMATLPDRFGNWREATRYARERGEETRGGAPKKSWYKTPRDAPGNRLSGCTDPLASRKT